MKPGKIAEIILAPFEKSAINSGIMYLEALYREGDSIKTVFKKNYEKDFPYLSYEVLEKNSQYMEKASGIKNFSLDLTSKYEKKIICETYIHPVENHGRWMLIIQRTESSDELRKTIAEYLTEALSQLSIATADDAPNAKSAEKYKNELLNIRDLQAKLFPKFDDIEEMDIRSAYLPAEFMSGTFIDGFFVDKSTYTLAACDVSDYGPASSFVGAAIRTILRTENVQKMIPSAMIEKVDARLKSIVSGNTLNIYLTIYQINLKTGKATISSYGNITTLFYTKKRNGIIDLAATDTGRLFNNRGFFRDLSISLEPGDALLYYTRGLTLARKEHSDIEFGIERLKNAYRENIDSGSLDIVHSIIESVYEFTDYSQMEEDIILVSMKRSV
ncbi:MAG TPA: SpoIIE family protein phosphatase [Spirochaetota bacterium]|nr:SpoIIE family protein phosphatase [Spirochaetota bacterium]